MQEKQAFSKKLPYAQMRGCTHLNLNIRKILFSQIILEFEGKKELLSSTNKLGAMMSIFQEISKLKFITLNLFTTNKIFMYSHG